jgi:hypothetical protein
MARTVKLFIAKTKTLPGFPRAYRTWRQETTEPFRRCERALVVRMPFCLHALVFGRWHARLEDEDAALAALGHRLTPYLERDKEKACDGVG